MRRRAVVIGMLPLLLGLNAVAGGGAAAQAASRSGDTRVTAGSQSTDFPRNKQNEPAVSEDIDAAHPHIAVSDSNDVTDNAPCAGGNCGFTTGTTANGVYF